MGAGAHADNCDDSARGRLMTDSKGVGNTTAPRTLGIKADQNSPSNCDTEVVLNPPHPGCRPSCMLGLASLCPRTHVAAENDFIPDDV